MVIYIILIIIGFILLIKGANLLVAGSSNIAKKYHIPEIIIGLTIVSIGTSMPELFVSLTSAIDNYSDIAIGNVIGSNIANLLLILGLSAIIRDIEFRRQTRILEIPMCMIFTIIFMYLCNSSNIITRYEGIYLLILFVMFITYTILIAIRAERKTKKLNVERNENISIIKNIIYILLGIVALKVGGDVSVDNAVKIAHIFNLNEKIISVTILAVGTSLPELVTSISAAFKGKSDIAIGNIIGSNIFNILFIMGISASLEPITYNPSYNMDFIVLIIAIIILGIFPHIKPKNKISRTKGIVYLILYVLYLVELLIK